MKQLTYIIFVTLFWGCAATHSETEKHQSTRNNVIEVKGLVTEIPMEDVLIGAQARVYLLNNYLIVQDFSSFVEQIHIFDKNNFRYIASTAPKGQGPTEITNMGSIGIDTLHNTFYVTDHGKLLVFSYEMDSVISKPNYKPTVKIKMNQTQFPSEYVYVNDTLCFGRIINPIGNSDFKPTVGKWNMKTGEINLMPYEHPDIKEKRTLCTTSIKDSIYIECYADYDLMTICDLNGNLKYNIYGPNYGKGTGREDYYRAPVIFKNKIIVAYSGEDPFRNMNSSGQPTYPTQLLVFDLAGNYIQTLDVGYQIVRYCYDEEDNRLLMSFNDEIQFGYLPLDGII